MNSTLDALRALNPNLTNRDFLLTWEHTDDEIRAVLLVAELFKELHRTGVSIRSFESGLAIAIFRDNSTRTRFSYASAVNALGLGLAELDEVKSQIAHGETVRETANMISFLAEVIGIRDDMYIGAGNAGMREVAAAVQDGYDQGVLHRRPSVINLQCDIDHPTQTLADLAHLKAVFGSLEALRGKKIAMTWAYSPSYGKPLSVPQGVIGLMTRLGMHVALAHPEGYGLLPEVVERAKVQAKASGGTFSLSTDMDDAFAGADIVYPKSWAPFHVMEQRTALLKQGDRPGLADLEKLCLAENAKHRDWECTEAKMQITREGKALYMHCLPADISGVSCAQGEVAASVFERYRIRTYQEAGFKPFVIAALVFLTRMRQPVKRLEQIIRRSAERA